MKEKLQGGQEVHQSKVATSIPKFTQFFCHDQFQKRKLTVRRAVIEHFYD